VSAEPADADAVFLRKLRWQCRRGMKEMDALLTGWLDRSYARAQPSVQRNFVVLLQTEDDVLWRWLAGRSRPELVELADLVDEIVATAVH
jgi:antitoxin CptB